MGIFWGMMCICRMTGCPKIQILVDMHHFAECFTYRCLCVDPLYYNAFVTVDDDSTFAELSKKFIYTRLFALKAPYKLNQIRIL